MARGSRLVECRGMPRPPRNRKPGVPRCDAAVCRPSAHRRTSTARSRAAGSHRRVVRRTISSRQSRRGSSQRRREKFVPARRPRSTRRSSRSSHLTMTCARSFGPTPTSTSRVCAFRILSSRWYVSASRRACTSSPRTSGVICGRRGECVRRPSGRRPRFGIHLSRV